MSKALRVVLVSLVVAVAGYCVYFHFATIRTGKLVAAPDAELQWLRQEFALSDEQFAKIAELHSAYNVKCGAMCAKLMDANNKVEALLRASPGQVTSDLKAAMAEVSADELECEQGMLEHVFAVSAVMPSASAERYRQMMEAQILRHNVRHTSLSPAPK